MPGSVEVLGFQPVERRPAQEAPAPLPDLSATLEAHRQQLLQQTAQIATQAVNAAISASNTTVVGTFQAIATILAVRFILLLAVVGGFILAVMAMQSQTTQSIGLLISYATLTVLPLVWLDRNGARRKGAE